MTKSKDRQAFDKAMKALVQVPKTELDKSLRDEAKAKKRRKQRKQRKHKR
jgi:hypothetical protein